LGRRKSQRPGRRAGLVGIRVTGRGSRFGVDGVAAGVGAAVVVVEIEDVAAAVVS